MGSREGECGGEQYGGVVLIARYRYRYLYRYLISLSDLRGQRQDDVHHA